MSRLGYPRWVGPALMAGVFVLGALLLLPSSRFWFGSPLLTTGTIQQITPVLAAVCAGIAAAAFPSRNRRRTAALDSLSSRPAWHLVLFRAAAIGLWVLAGYLFLVVGAVAVSAAVEPGSRLGVGNVVIGAAGIVLALAAGTVVGSLWPKPITPLLVLIGGLVLMVTGFGASDSVRHLFLYHGTVPLWGEPRVDVLVLKLVWVAALIAMFTLIAAGFGWGVTSPVRWHRVGMAAVGVVVVGTAGIPIGLALSDLGREPMARSSAAQHQVCGGQQPRVCLWDDHRRHLDDVVRMVETAKQVSGVVPGDVRQYEEFGMSAPAGNPDFFRGGNGVIHISNGFMKDEELVQQLAGQWHDVHKERCGTPREELFTAYPELDDLYQELFTAALAGPVDDLAAWRGRHAAASAC